MPETRLHQDIDCSRSKCIPSTTIFCRNENISDFVTSFDRWNVLAMNIFPSFTEGSTNRILNRIEPTSIILIQIETKTKTNTNRMNASYLLIDCILIWFGHLKSNPIKCGASMSLSRSQIALCTVYTMKWTSINWFIIIIIICIELLSTKNLLALKIPIYVPIFFCLPLVFFFSFSHLFLCIHSKQMLSFRSVSSAV